MITIITKDNCPFCIRAKNLLTQKGVPFISKKIGVDIEREEVLEQYPGIRTVPIIIEDGRLIGGYDQLVEEVNREDSTIGKVQLNG